VNALMPCLSVLFAALFIITPAYADEPIPETEHRAVVLVRDLESPAGAPEVGRIAAEAVAGALEERGLAIAVRPRYVEREVVETAGTAVEVKSVDPGEQPEESRSDVFLVPRREEQRRELSAPESDYVVEGAAGVIDATWWLRATLRDRVSNAILLEGASAQAEGEKGLFQSAQRIAPKLEEAFRADVLEKRAEAVRQAVALGLMDRAVAMGRLEKMHANWPDAFAPTAVAFLLACEAHERDRDAIETWRARAEALLPAAGPAGQRLLMRLRLNLAPRDAPGSTTAPAATP